MYLLWLIVLYSGSKNFRLKLLCQTWKQKYSHWLIVAGELLSIIDIVTSLGDAIGRPKDPTTMHVSIHKDNARALILAETLPPKCTP